ncbi:hypothetical protein XELAEV_18034532mg [Xenopus laevis]|uniref:Uncharacterized protein n=1 Tax=Xenopus laevis TaxID=8355 RepID=A0A974CF43_XENLA|nr:hypothetical protein XELAEV_18034532mg [Xenopus laevis]
MLYLVFIPGRPNLSSYSFHSRTFNIPSVMMGVVVQVQLGNFRIILKPIFHSLRCPPPRMQRIVQYDFTILRH